MEFLEMFLLSYASNMLIILHLVFISYNLNKNISTRLVFDITQIASYNESYPDRRSADLSPEMIWYLNRIISSR